MSNPRVSILLRDGRKINCELYPEIAPISVKNFLDLVGKKFYDGLIFHRVIDKFMIQAGGYYIDNNTLFDKEAPNTIKGEFSANGVENNLKHKLGILSMARSNDPNSASSQFFICSASSPHLDGNYAAFGRVLSGMEYVDGIAQMTTGENDKPLKDAIIVSAKLIPQP